MTKKLLIKDDSNKLSIKIYKEIVNKVVGKKTNRVTISDEEYSTFASSETNSIITTIPFTIGKSKVKHELSIEYKLYDDEASITLFTEDSLGTTTTNDIASAISLAIKEVVSGEEKEDAKPKYVKLDSLDDAEKVLDLNKDAEKDSSFNIDLDAVGDLVHKVFDSFASGIQELASDENKQKIKDKLNEAKDTIKDNVDKAKENIQTKAQEYKAKAQAIKKYDLDFDWMTITLIDEDNVSPKALSFNKDELYFTIDSNNGEFILGNKIKFEVSVDEDGYLTLNKIISLDDNKEYDDLSAIAFHNGQTKYFDIDELFKNLIYATKD